MIANIIHFTFNIYSPHTIHISPCKLCLISTRRVRTYLDYDIKPTKVIPSTAPYFLIDCADDHSSATLASQPFTDLQYATFGGPGSRNASSESRSSSKWCFHTCLRSKNVRQTSTIRKLSCTSHNLTVGARSSSTTERGKTQERLARACPAICPKIVRCGQ